MEDNIKNLIREANKTLQTADHLAYVTYPIVNELKLLVTITENIYVSMSLGMEALMRYDLYYKRISHIPTDFNLRLEVFKKVSSRYNIERIYVSTIKDIKDLLEHQKKSPVEFTRKDKLIMLSSNYKIQKIISIEKVKEYLNQAKPFISKVNRVLLNTNDRRFA